jgi:hypothetical protein
MRGTALSSSPVRTETVFTKPEEAETKPARPLLCIKAVPTTLLLLMFPAMPILQLNPLKDSLPTLDQKDKPNLEKNKVKILSRFLPPLQDTFPAACTLHPLS